jgi:hypothetical protein
MGLKHPGQGKVVEPSSARGIPEEVQLLARSLMGMPRYGSATTSPSLWLRAPHSFVSLPKRLTRVNRPCFPVLTTKAPSRERHQPDSRRTMSPTVTPST